MKTILNIKRPAGNIEQVDVSAKFTGMTPHLFAQIKEATAKAGRGEVLSYEYVTTAEEDERNAKAAKIAEIEAQIAKADRAGNYEGVIYFRKQLESIK